MSNRGGSTGGRRGGGGRNRGGRGGNPGGPARGSPSFTPAPAPSPLYAPQPAAASAPRPAPAPAPASPAPPSPRAQAPAVASSSSTAAASLVSEMEQKLTLAPVAPPRPARPGFGTAGVKVQVRANHFLVQVADRDLHHYDVSISPEVPSKINRDVINQLVVMYAQSHMGKRMPAYDGMKSIYTARPLPFISKEFLVKLPEKEDQAGSASKKRNNREFKVCIKLANRPDLYQLQEFLRGRLHESPQETIQVLDVVLRAAPSQKYSVVGRSFFHPDLGRKGELGSGMEYWRGFYQSLRPTQFGLSLNIDVSARAFYEPIPVTQFVEKHFGGDRNFSLSRGLSDRDRILLKKNLRGVKVTLSYGSKRTYRITGLSAQPLRELTFTLEDKQTKVSVIQYYREKYNINLELVALPALQCGNDSRPAYLPMELASIIPGQRYTRKLSETQVTNMLRATCQRPPQREASIHEMVRRNSYNKEKLVNKEFGIEVKHEMALLEARVLAPPQLKYHDTGREAKATPQMGAWNMMRMKMFNGANVKFWTFVNFSRLPEDFNDFFLESLVGMCNSKGVQFHPEPLVPVRSAHPNQIDRVLRTIHKESVQKLQAMGQGSNHLQLLIIILPDVSGSYGPIKRLCETELGIVTQCCKPKPAQKLSPQYLENLSMKINVKVGGRNTVLNDAILRKLPIISDRPTIIIGADVTHPQAGEDSSASIAAVVASMDWPEVSKYRGILSAQAHREEIIQDLYKQTLNDGGVVHSGIIRELFIAFRRSTGQKPHRIIFYRDGVSEGQFSHVLLWEIDAIRKACASLEPGYMPPITFVVVQKRHHTRLFPVDTGKTDRSGNIQPGTVVDTKICHRTEFDFYLNSHAGIQGTSRPTHYHVLFDENNFTADALQVLTNNLCYTYARCTRSVSIVPPAYYAHLAAFRARYYMEGDASDGASSVGRSSGGGVAQTQVLPNVHEYVKDVMFFC